MLTKRQRRQKEQIVVSIQQLAQCVVMAAEEACERRAQIAKSALLSPSTVYRIATGRTMDPRGSTICGLCRAAGVDLKVMRHRTIIVEV